MKTLIILRHAKSSWDSPSQRDFDRPLNTRGERDAPRMAAAIKALELNVTEIRSSTAVRASSTARLVAEGIDFDAGAITPEKRLYEASRDQILNIVDDLSNEHDCVMLVGHNPGLHSIVEYFSGKSFGNYPTCALSVLSLPESEWQAHYHGCATLTQFLTPKTLG